MGLTVSEQTSTRLEQYGLFSSQTIQAVAQVAKKQATYEHYQDFFDDSGVGEPFMHYYAKRRGVHVVDVPPQSTRQKGVIAMHLPMGNPLDTNQLYQVATIAVVNPEYRVVAFGNPSGKPFSFKQQRRSLREYFSIAFGKNKRAVVAGELHYLQLKGYTNVRHIGYSFGAHKALLASLYAPQDSIEGVTVIDPVAHSRYARQLLGDFQRTFGPMGEYVNRTEIKSYFEARKATAEVRYTAGLARPINVAIGFMLARLDFIPLLHKVIEHQQHAAVTVAWGTDSELGNHAHLQANMHTIVHANARAKALPLRGDKHTLANDIHLHAAITLQGGNHKLVS